MPLLPEPDPESLEPPELPPPILVAEGVVDEVVIVVNEVKEGDEDGEVVGVVAEETKLVGDNCESCILNNLTSSVAVSVESVSNGAYSTVAIMSTGEISLGIYHCTGLRSYKDPRWSSTRNQTETPEGDKV